MFTKQISPKFLSKNTVIPKKKLKNSSENPKDFENEREKAMKQFYDSFALIEEGKYKRNIEPKLFYSFDDKNDQEIEEKADDSDSNTEENEKKKKRKCQAAEIPTQFQTRKI